MQPEGASMRSLWEGARNAVTQAHPPTGLMCPNLHFNKVPGDYFAH